MSEEPSKKRKLETENEPESPPSLEDNIQVAKDAKLWFDDGSIVIIAENHPFKVHKAVLAAKSNFFSSMFSLPQPQTLEAGEHFGGIPVVYLSDDWEAVQCVLNGIYHAELLLKPSHEVYLSFHTITSWLRLGDKYEIESLREAAKAHLLAAYPFHLTPEAHRSRHLYLEELFGSGRDLQLGHIKVVNLIRQDDSDRPDLFRSLPVALYECSRLPVELLLEGLENKEVPSLSPADLTRLFRGKQILLDYDLEFLKKLVMHTCPPTCSNSKHCPTYAHTLYNRHWDGIVREAGDLAASQASINEWVEKSALCKACKKSIKGALAEYCETTWDDLKQIFDISPY